MKRTYLAGIAAALLTATSAHSATIPGIGEQTVGSFDVTPAVSSTTAKTHSLWFLEEIPGISSRFTLSSPGTFRADANGAVLKGSTVSLINEMPDASAGLDMFFRFDRDFSDLRITTPGFKDVFDQNGPNAIEHGNEDYFDIESGTISGTGTLAGLEITISRNPVDGSFGTQVGGGILQNIGANQHNPNFGLSSWFLIDTVDSANCLSCDQALFQGLVGKQGDVNFDLSPAAVPLPAAGFLLLGALASVAGVRSRKQKA
jgi:hypothetical protein